VIGEFGREQREEMRAGLAGKIMHREAMTGRGVGLPMKTRREKMCQAFSNSVAERTSESVSASESLFMTIMEGNRSRQKREK